MYGMHPSMAAMWVKMRSQEAMKEAEMYRLAQLAKPRRQRNPVRWKVNVSKLLVVLKLRPKPQ
jgi:hypothetical protein